MRAKATFSYLNQRTNGPVNAQLISGPSIRKKNIQDLDKMAEQTLTLITNNPQLTRSVYNINRIPGHRMQKCPKKPSLSHFSI